MGQRVYIDENNNARIIETGPIGPTGVSADSKARIADILIPPSLDLTPLGGIDTIVNEPTTVPSGLIVAIVGRGEEYDGLYRGTAIGEMPGELVKLSGISPADTSLVYATGILSTSGAIDGLWVTNYRILLPPVGWTDPVDLSSDVNGGTFTVHIFINATNGFVNGPGGIGAWPLPEAGIIAFANQADADNNGVYRGATTDPEDPQPLVKISDLPNPETLIATSVLVETDELLSMIDGFSEMPPDEIAYEVLGPFILGYNDFFFVPGHWSPLTYGWGRMSELMAAVTSRPITYFTGFEYDFDPGRINVGTIMTMDPTDTYGDIVVPEESVYIDRIKMLLDGVGEVDRTVKVALFKFQRDGIIDVDNPLFDVELTAPASEAWVTQTFPEVLLDPTERYVRLFQSSHELLEIGAVQNPSNTGFSYGNADLIAMTCLGNNATTYGTWPSSVSPVGWNRPYSLLRASGFPG
jgi:hypothetical protein